LISDQAPLQSILLIQQIGQVQFSLPWPTDV
jgi:hypothetical protein